MPYISVSGEYRSEKVIERSRFITTSLHIEGEEEARAFIARINAEFKDATHNCYAYIADATGNAPRFSDDGEPSGTAGMPILEVIKNKKIDWKERGDILRLKSERHCWGAPSGLSRWDNAPHCSQIFWREL